LPAELKLDIHSSSHPEAFIALSEIVSRKMIIMITILSMDMIVKLHMNQIIS